MDRIGSYGVVAPRCSYFSILRFKIHCMLQYLRIICRNGSVWSTDRDDDLNTDKTEVLEGLKTSLFKYLHSPMDGAKLSQSSKG